MYIISLCAPHSLEIYGLKVGQNVADRSELSVMEGDVF